MSFNATWVAHSGDVPRIEAHDYTSQVFGGTVTIASVTVGDQDSLTIQASEPGALRRLAEALIEAENRADVLRAAREVPVAS